MATSSLEDSKEKTYGTKIARLLIDGGTETLRKAFDGFHPPANLSASLHRSKRLLAKRLRRRVLNSTQWDLLYPPANSGLTADSKQFDITLLFVLLRNICGLRSPPSGWDALPPATDQSLEANLARIKYYRNEVYGHITRTGLCKAEFKQYWKEISTALKAMGLDKVSINLLRSSPLDGQEYLKLLDEWFTSDQLLKDIVFEMKGQMEKGFDEMREELKDIKETCVRLDKDTQKETTHHGTSQVSSWNPFQENYFSRCLHFKMSCEIILRPGF